MALDVTGYLNAIVSHALASGLFERVNQHEPKNAPGNGLTAAIWADRVEPYALASGLAATSVKVTFNVRAYSKMLQEPQDSIDPNIVAAVDTLMNAYSGDFTLGGLVRNVDLLGQAGPGLFAQAGYIQQDSKMFRVVTISLTVVVNDVWSQAA